jgi:hypothetical protein
VIVPDHDDANKPVPETSIAAHEVPPSPASYKSSQSPQGSAQHGPPTEPDRAIASRNALRHGLTTERVILFDEQHRQLGLDICRGKRLQELRCVARRCRP